MRVAQLRVARDVLEFEAGSLKQQPLGGQKHIQWYFVNGNNLRLPTSERYPWCIDIGVIFDAPFRFDLIHYGLWMMGCPWGGFGEVADHVDAIIPTNVGRDIAILRGARNQRRQDIAADF
jgi:hypothetical protein